MTDLDLTPAELPSRRPRRWRNWAVMAVFAAAAAFVLYQALSSARVYFLNVDEAVAQRESLGDGTFQMQGTVVSEPSADAEGALRFVISFGGADADVRHIGDEPSTLFQVGQPVVAEGHWDGQTFVSSQILVKHSEEYIEDNPDRVDYELEDQQLDSTAPDGA